jgi:hypothetical protein
MELSEFRLFFQKHSGRYDLVNSDGSDNGANLIINAGQRYLDRLVDIPQGIGRVFKDIVAGQYLVKFEDSRAILEVWCLGPNSDGDIVRLPLKKYTQQELRGIEEKTLEEAYVQLSSDMTQERPTYYTPAQLRLVTRSDGLSGGIGGMMDVLAEGHQTYNGIFFMPPSDGEYTIEIIGNFYSRTLSADTDHSFWSDQHYMLLYMATMRELEIIHRNSEGKRDWEDSIRSEIIGIDMDGVAESVSDITEMEG